MFPGMSNGQLEANRKRQNFPKDIFFLHFHTVESFESKRNNWEIQLIFLFMIMAAMTECLVDI